MLNYTIQSPILLVPMKRRKLPLGIQNFREIRTGGYYYVDKTALALKLINEGKSYLLSRPRRFGKSLFLDTLKELFEGNEPLFQGLSVHDQWNWSVKYPDSVVLTTLLLGFKFNP